MNVKFVYLAIILVFLVVRMAIQTPVLSFLKLCCMILIPVGTAVLSLSVLVDRFFYGEFVIPQINFFVFNVFNDYGAMYGSHPWYWYFSHGLPIIAGTTLPFAIVGAYLSERLTLFYLLVWVLFAHSFVSHKEFRFIFPVLPVLLSLAGKCLAFIADYSRMILKAIMIFLFFSNLMITIYTSFFHQRGALDLMANIRHRALSLPYPSYLILMPCHSIPHYSHIHNQNVSLFFLECEHNNSVEEFFYQSPVEWLGAYLKSVPRSSALYFSATSSSLVNFSSRRTRPSHIIIFDVLNDILLEFLEKNTFVKCGEIFHTHFPVSSKEGRYIYIYCEGRDGPANEPTVLVT